MISNIYQIITIPSGGGITTITTIDNIQLYIIDSTSGGSVTLSGDYTIAYSGTPIEGTVAIFDYRGLINLNGHVVTVLGRVLTQEEVNSKLKIFCEWDNTLGIWNVILLKENNTNLLNGVGVHTISAASGLLGFIPGVDPNVIVLQGTPSLSADWVFTWTTGSYNIKDGDQFIVYYRMLPTLNGHHIILFGEQLDDLQAVSGNLIAIATWSTSLNTFVMNIVRDSSTLQILPSDCQSAMTDYIVTLPVSFENNEQGNNTILYIPHAYQILRQSAIVTKALAGTDAGSITIQQNGSTTGTLSLSASSAINTTTTQVNGVPTTTAGNTHINVISAKTTAGGKALVSLVIRKMNN